MPFKIVKTIERGRENLSIIPSNWEKAGKLRWPGKNINLKLMVKNENSKPLPDWTTIQCTVKRSFIATYKKAEEELNIMLNHSDTSDYPGDEARKSLPKSIDYNAIADSLMQQQAEDISTVPIAENEIHIRDSLQESTATSTDCNNVVQVISDTYIQPNEFLENQKLILANQKSIMENQSFIHETQKNVLEKIDRNYRKMTNLLVLVEDSFSRLGKDNGSVLTTAEVNLNESESFILKPIANAREFDAFENMLSNKTQKQKLHFQYALMCKKADGTGINCAYKLLDIMFTREFLCQCSWSGGSRGQAVKIAMKGYKNTLDFFFGLIYSWDSTYRRETNENFFKTVLKNAVKRLDIKNIRASTKRTRLQKGVLPGPSCKRQKITTISTPEGIIEKITDNSHNQEPERDIQNSDDEEVETEIDNNQVSEKETDSLC